MSLSIPGGFPAAGQPASYAAAHTAASGGIHRAAENDAAGAARLPASGGDMRPEGQRPPAHVNRVNRVNRVNTARDATLQKKLLRAAQGNLAISLPAAAAGISASAATAAAMRGNVAGNAGQAALAGGMELAVGLLASAVTTALSHHTGLVSRIWPPSSEQEVLDRTFLIAAVMNAGHSIAGGLCYDMAAKAMLRQEITHEKLLESVIDQVIGKFVAAGVIGAGATLMYKHNRRFRDMVDSTLASMLEEIKRRAGPRPHATPGSPEAAMEEGRLPAASAQEGIMQLVPVPSAATPGGTDADAEAEPQSAANRRGPDNRPS